MRASEIYHARTQKTGLYNIMPLENVSSVLQNGILSHRKAELLEHDSVAMAEIQARRERVEIPNGMMLHEYVNLYFDPRNPMMYRLRSIAETLCILKVSLDVLDLDNVVVSDQNASCKYAAFYVPEQGVGDIDFDAVFLRDWRDPDEIAARRKKHIKCAEVLVPECVPPQYLMAAAVLNRAGEDVLLRAGFPWRIYVEPDWFFGR